MNSDVDRPTLSGQAFTAWRGEHIRLRALAATDTYAIELEVPCPDGWEFVLIGLLSQQTVLESGGLFTVWNVISTRAHASWHAHNWEYAVQRLLESLPIGLVLYGEGYEQKTQAKPAQRRRSSGAQRRQLTRRRP